MISNLEKQVQMKTKELEKIVLENNLLNEKLDKLEKFGQVSQHDAAKTPTNKVQLIQKGERNKSLIDKINSNPP